MPLEYFLSLGSNIAPEENLVKAVRLLKEKTRLLGVSKVYETVPLGPAGQPEYLNAAVHVEADLEPAVFHREVVSEIERQLGRVRTGDKFAPRTIDIDILLAGSRITRIDHRRIPSDEIHSRAFVALPLAEIAPDFIHPKLGITLGELASRFDPGREGLVWREDIRLD